MSVTRCSNTRRDSFEPDTVLFASSTSPERQCSGLRSGFPISGLNHSLSVGNRVSEAPRTRTERPPPNLWVHAACGFSRARKRPVPDMTSVLSATASRSLSPMATTSCPKSDVVVASYSRHSAPTSDWSSPRRLAR